MKKIILLLLVILLFGCSTPVSTVSKELTVDNFRSELTKNDLILSSKETASASTIGSLEAYRFKANDVYIDYCVFDKSSKEFKLIQTTNNVHIEFGDIKVDKKAVVKNNIVILCDEHPEKEKITKIFKSF